MKLKLILGILFWTATMQICLAQGIARAYNEANQLEELKTFDAQGHITFKKWCLSDTHFEMQAYAWDTNGKPTQEWEVLWRTDIVHFKELRYFEDRIETWMPTREWRLSGDADFAKAIMQFKRDGLPNSSEELLQYRAIRNVFDGPMYCSELSILNSAHLPLTTTYFDIRGEVASKERSFYDASGRCIRIIESLAGDEEDYVEHLLSYDSQGKIIQDIALERMGDETDTLLVCAYTYKDMLLTERMDRIGSKGGSRWTKTTRTYDKQQRLVRDEITDNVTQGPNTYKTFSYDTQSRIATEEWFRKENGSLKKIRSVHWSYE